MTDSEPVVTLELPLEMALGAAAALIAVEQPEASSLMLGQIGEQSSPADLRAAAEALVATWR